MKRTWLNKNVFVTGCTGLLGSWLSEELLSQGANVVALVRDHVPQSRVNREGLSEKISAVAGCLEDTALVERALNEYEIDTVFHLGAQTIVPIANNNPLSTFESNIKGTSVLLEACRRNRRVRKIVVASSDKAYGDHEHLPYTENMPLRGRNPYDVSKSCADLISQMYFHSFGLPVCVTRCGNLFGGGDLNFNRIVPGTIRSVLFGEQPVIRSDGSFVRDYFYVRDAAQAYIRLAEQMEDPGLWGQAFNFGNDEPITVLEIVKEILSAMGTVGLAPLVLNQANSEIHKQYLSSEKARTMLNWSPTFSLQKGLAETVDWYKSFFSSAK